MSAASPETSPHRRALLAKVHLAAKELKLDRDAYGEVLVRVTGVDSAKTLTDAQMAAVLEEFRRLGWQGAAPRKVPGKSQARLIYGLWKELAPDLADGSRDALRTFVRRQTVSTLHPKGVEAPEFLNSKQANLVIEGLKAWLSRVKASRQAAAPRNSPCEVAGEARPKGPGP